MALNDVFGHLRLFVGKTVFVAETLAAECSLPADSPRPAEAPIALVLLASPVSESEKTLMIGCSRFIRYFN